MPIATPQQFRDMISAARRHKFAYPAINVSSSQTLNAALRGFSEARSDGIIQITTSAATYLSGPARDPATGATAFAQFAHQVAAHAPVLIALHTDHATNEHLDNFLHPLLLQTRRRRSLGHPPLFNSHMFDGSNLPLPQNLDIAAQLLEEMRELGLLLEIEIGVVGGEEDGVDGRGAEPGRLYSTPEDARTVFARLGSGRGRYLLAATFGNVHGHYAASNVKLKPVLLRDLQSAVPRHETFDFVFHGGSGSEPSEVEAAIANGVVKMNLDTDMQHAFTSAVAAHVLSHADSLTNGAAWIDKRIYDPRAWGRAAEAAMAARIAGAATVLGSSGRSLILGP